MTAFCQPLPRSVAEEMLQVVARALCDRHAGVGADGLLILRAAASKGTVRMELRNSDGGRAETSGNGLRCFALAVIDAGLTPAPELVIETDAGMRRAVLLCRDGPGSGQVSVEMGQLKVLPSLARSDASLPGSTDHPWRCWSVDVGNPHFVLLAPSLEGVEIGTVGPVLERLRPGGQNVEIATLGPGDDEVSMVVWERGAGVTLACGTGSAAAAAALHSASLCPTVVRVRNPGGTAEVALSGGDPLAPSAVLAGPVRRVARIEVDPAELGAKEAVVAAS